MSDLKINASSIRRLIRDHDLPFLSVDEAWEWACKHRGDSIIPMTTGKRRLILLCREHHQRERTPSAGRSETKACHDEDGWLNHNG